MTKPLKEWGSFYVAFEEETNTFFLEDKNRMPDRYLYQGVRYNFDDYTVTTDGGLSFSISGSKIRYAHPLSSDLGTFEKLFPNAIDNMRSVMKNLGQKEFIHLEVLLSKKVLLVSTACSTSIS